MPVTFYYVNKCTFVVAPGPFTVLLFSIWDLKWNSIHMYI